MKVALPVQMFPIATRAADSGTFVLCVVIGLALYMAAKQQQAVTASTKAKS